MANCARLSRGRVTQQRSTRNTDINYGNSGNRFDPRNPDRLGIFTFSSRTRKKKLYNNRFDILFRLTLFHAIPTSNSISRNPRLFFTYSRKRTGVVKKKKKKERGTKFFALDSLFHFAVKCSRESVENEILLSPFSNRYTCIAEFKPYSNPRYRVLNGLFPLFFLSFPPSILFHPRKTLIQKDWRQTNRH